MAYTITGTLTSSTQANRDAALGRINTAMSSYNYTAIATAFTAGVATPTTTTITISIQDGTDDQMASGLANAIYNAATSSNRHTSGYLSVNKV